MGVGEWIAKKKKKRVRSKRKEGEYTQKREDKKMREIYKRR